eukprot:m.136296 g.136296  ORF g.136296 m.136296 type:complete len:341 (+) comp22622_c0_seq2:2-1024(+)
MNRVVGSAVAAVGGAVPVSTAEFGARAARAAMAPRWNPLKAHLDHTVLTPTHPEGPARLQSTTVPPTLGIFLDTPWHQLTTSHVKGLAKAGFLWVVPDGEHLGVHGRYGADQHELLLRHGITPIQRLPREAVSDHGDSLALGARATMMPYATTLEQVETYLTAVSFPSPTVAAPSPHNRGGYPFRDGAGTLEFNSATLLNTEGRETQACVQFETQELLFDSVARDAVLDLMAEAGPNRAFGFVGALDATIRTRDPAAVAAAVDALGIAAMDRGVHVGKLCGGTPGVGGIPDPDETERAMVHAIETGYRLIGLSVLSSDLHYMGAHHVASPFWSAVERCGF